ncbi:MAG: methylated-DNA--[protein]-cysteine S-methyltransferase [Acidimicrobiaceae bacterium]|nr:methylated-DNA--[protein]-cysteine S-methyltransferase [Acidimicrobiaceae bacterium]MDE0608200.1 methylated-DNA--[protein]-cysteine S-methyltransferase [Acidimicrobiaceae bacterium]
MILTRQVDSPIGRLRLVATDQGLSHLLFEQQAGDDTGSDGDSAEADNHPVLVAATAQLEEYFAGQRQEFDIPLDLSGTEFQRAAWSALAGVPFGETRSYRQQAEAVGRPEAVRAIGAANGRNPVPIVLPCHRIVGSDGSLTGYGGGLPIKEFLLNHEQSQSKKH